MGLQFTYTAYNKRMGVKKKLSRNGSFQFRNGEMLFSRVGPIKAVKQKNSRGKKNVRSPEKRGLWAFPFPLFDWFFVPSGWSWDGENELKKDKPLPIKYKRLFEKRIKGLQRRRNISEFDQIGIDSEIEVLQECIDKNVILSENYYVATALNKPINKKRKFWWGGPIYAKFGPKGALPLGSDKEWYCFDHAEDYLDALRKQLIDTWDEGDSGAVFRKDGFCNLSIDHLEVFIPYKG